MQKPPVSKRYRGFYFVRRHVGCDCTESVDAISGLVQSILCPSTIHPHDDGYPASSFFPWIFPAETGHVVAAFAGGGADYVTKPNRPARRAGNPRR